MLTQAWQVRLFGNLALRRGGDSFSRFSTRQAGTLLAFLAFYRGQNHSREALCELLWPGDPPAASRARLRVTLTSLRRRLEPPSVLAGSVILTDGHEHVRLAEDAVSTDVTEVQHALELLMPTEDAPVTDERLAAAQVIVTRFTHPLLSAFYDDWVISERERLAQAAVERLSALARRLPPERGVELARHAARIDPLAEEPLFALLPLLFESGQHGAALKAFRSFVLRWEAAMGIPVSPTLLHLVDCLPSARRAPPPLTARVAVPPGRTSGRTPWR